MIVFLGMAGSGKSTQCRRLSMELGLHWISIGEVLRQSEHGKSRDAMLHGLVLDDTIVMPIVEKELKRSGDTPEILLDGCPRTVAQARWLAESKDPSVRVVIHLVLDDEIALRRLLQRQREDDTEHSIRQRFAGYHRDIEAVLAEFQRVGCPIRAVRADATKDEVYEAIVRSVTKP